MTVTATGLTKAAGAAAAAAGAIFIAVQIGHPSSGSFTTETSQRRPQRASGGTNSMTAPGVISASAHVIVEGRIVSLRKSSMGVIE